MISVLDYGAAKDEHHDDRPAFIRAVDAARDSRLGEEG